MHIHLIAMQNVMLMYSEQKHRLWELQYISKLLITLLCFVVVVVLLSLRQYVFQTRNDKMI